MSSLVIAILVMERIAFATIGLLAAIYGQYWWGIFMGVILIILIASTSIKVKDRDEE